MPQKNGKMMTQDEHKTLAEITLQNDERIEQLWDDLLHLKLLAASKGWRFPDVQMLRVSAQERSKASAFQKTQRQRLRKSLGLI